MKLYYSILISCLFCQLLLGCDNLSEQGSAHQPGFFALSSSYELGDLKRTARYIFSLSNQGDTDIVDVTISSSNPAFVVAPLEIPVIQPNATQSLNRSLEVFAIHGFRANESCCSEVMSPGLNQTRLTVRGKTTDANGDTLRITKHATLNVNALLLAVEIHDRDGLVDLSSSTTTGTEPGIAANIRRFDVADGALRVINTGNVDILVTSFTRVGVGQHETIDIKLAPGEEGTIDRDDDGIFLRIDGNGVISDRNVIQFHAVGLIYMSFS